MLLLLFINSHRIYKEKMKSDLLASELLTNPHKDVLYSQYHSTLSSLIDKRGPSHTKHVKAQYIARWVNESVIVAKEIKHLYEHIWCRNKSSIDHITCRGFISTTEPAKSDFMRTQIQENHQNPKKLW